MYDILRHRAEIRRAINNRRYEMTPGGGILVPSMGAHIGGVFETWINGHDHQVDPNIIPTASLNHILDVVCHGTAQVTTWYVTPFEGDVTPGASYTAANFTSNTTEFTDYDESTRVAWVEAAASAGVTTTSRSRAASPTRTCTAARCCRRRRRARPPARCSRARCSRRLAASTRPTC